MPSNDRDAEIAYLYDKIDELRRDLKAVIAAQCVPATSLRFDDYLARSVRSMPLTNVIPTAYLNSPESVCQSGCKLCQTDANTPVMAEPWVKPLFSASKPCNPLKYGLFLLIPSY